MPNTDVKLATKSNSILIIEDEAAIRTGLVDVFVYHGYHVDYAEEGLSGLEKALSGEFDLILLDVMLPNMDGYSICEKIRINDRLKKRSQAIIMLTAKTSDEDIINGLSLGADDYVAKPFSVAQLVLRVKAVLRRSLKEVSQETSIQLSQNIKIDCLNLSVQNGANIFQFTKREMEVLEYLQLHNQRPVSREELLAEVWGYASELEIETRTVDIHIARIRRKIEVDPKDPQFLMTIRGAGYRLMSLQSK